MAPRKTTKRPVRESTSKQLVDRATKVFDTMLRDTTQVTERLAELELALEDQGWIRQSMDGEKEFTRHGLWLISRLSRLSYLKNPLIRRAVNIMRVYVFGQGFTVACRDQEINEAVRMFLDDPSNRRILGSPLAVADRNRDLMHDGNVFFALFTDPITGRVQVRTLPFDEMQDIHMDPDDRMRPRLYKRQWTRHTLQDDGNTLPEERIDYYPDIEWYRQAPAKERPKTIGGYEVHWDVPVYHIKVGEVGQMRFGVSELYPALDWSRAVVNDLSDYATVKRALARISMIATTKAGKTGVAALGTKLRTTLANPGSITAETNPPPVTGSIAAMSAGNTIEPFRTAGAIPGSDDGRALRNMVSAATGIPETMLMGDADVGNLATAKTLDRPTELQVIERQTFWGQALQTLCTFAVRAAAEATRPRVTGVVWALDDTVGYERAIADDETRDLTVDVTWPPVLEDDVMERVNAILAVATLDGKRPVGTMPEKVMIRMLLEVIEVPDVDEVMGELYPNDDPGPILSIPEPQPLDQFGRPVLPKPGEQAALPAPSESADALRDLLMIARRLTMTTEAGRAAAVQERLAASRVAEATERENERRAREHRELVEVGVKVAEAVGKQEHRVEVHAPITVQPAAPAVVSAPITVEAAKPANVTVPITVEAAEPAPAPHVTVPITVEGPNVNVQPADVRVEHHDRGPESTTKSVEYDKQGNPIASVEKHSYRDDGKR